MFTSRDPRRRNAPKSLSVEVLEINEIQDEVEADGPKGGSLRALERETVSEPSPRKWALPAVAVLLVAIVGGWFLVQRGGNADRASAGASPAVEPAAEETAPPIDETPTKTAVAEIPEEAPPVETIEVIPVEVQLAGLPAGAKASFDDRSIEDGRISGPPGLAGKLHIEAESFEPLTLELTLTKTKTLDVAELLRPTAPPEEDSEEDERRRRRHEKRERAVRERAEEAATPPAVDDTPNEAQPAGGPRVIKGRHDTEVSVEYPGE